MLRERTIQHLVDNPPRHENYDCWDLVVQLVPKIAERDEKDSTVFSKLRGSDLRKISTLNSSMGDVVRKVFKDRPDLVKTVNLPQAKEAMHGVSEEEDEPPELDPKPQIEEKKLSQREESAKLNSGSNNKIAEEPAVVLSTNRWLKTSSLFPC